MEQIVTGSQMKALDDATIENIGIPSLVLMERAALALCDAMEAEGYLEGRLLFLCGSGNNGADGVAAARILTLRGYEADVCILGNPLRFTQEMKKQVEIAEKYGISFVKTYRCSEYTTIVDSLLGVGTSRNLEGVYKKAVEEIRHCGCHVVSVDIPTGICADTGRILGAAVRADLTVTFAYKKAGLCLYPGALYAGKLVTAEIGIHRQDFPLDGTEIFACEPADLQKIRRDPGGNKGTFGKVFLIAGSRDIFGAAYLSGLAAMRTGAGMLKICTREENRQQFSCFPEAMLLTYDDTSDLKALVREGLAWADTAGMGPGVGTGAQAARLLDVLLEECTCPLVLDADAVNLLSGKKEKLKSCKAPVILTPHLGEFSRLTGTEIAVWKEDPVNITREAASSYRVILVCKDARTVVSDGTRSWINLSGNDGMATAGSGDVLTGTILGLLAQKLAPKDAAVLGVYLHGCAGDRAAAAKGRAGMLAGDILEEIPKILCSLEGKEGKS